MTLCPECGSDDTVEHALLNCPLLQARNLALPQALQGQPSYVTISILLSPTPPRHIQVSDCIRYVGAVWAARAFR